MKPAVPPGSRLAGGPECSASAAAAVRRPKHVFCFGDSLTAGTSPPERAEHPYGKHLLDALQSHGPPGASGVDGTPTATVEWLGLPGWTATSLLKELDLKGELGQTARDRREREEGGTAAASSAAGAPPFDLVIILAGTNDLAYETKPWQIVSAIQDIHSIAHGLGCPTMALGIPPSGYQSQSEQARLLARSVNDALKSWAENECPYDTRYVPYPIEDFDRSTGFWSPDGLHFSPEGYKFVADALAPIVAEILWD